MSKPLKEHKVAIVHDYLNQFGGGERVLESLAEIFPEAPIYTSIYDHELMKTWLKILPERIHTNFISKLPFIKSLYKHYFFLYPLAFRFTKLSGYDLVISTSSYASKFVRVRKGAIHICYIHTVPRFLWGYDTELSRYYKVSFDKYFSWVYKILVPGIKYFLKKADFSAAQKVDYFIANSKEVKNRVKLHYKREAQVIYPPVNTKRFEQKTNKNDNMTAVRDEYYLIVSRLGGYKKVELAVLAFNKLGKRLKVVGAGPQLQYLKKIAAPNVELLGKVEDSQVEILVKNCKAFIFPGLEDFGIAMVEALAAGKAVIAYDGGGAKEIVIGEKTGILFKEQTSQAIIKAVLEFEKKQFNPVESIKQAQKFSQEVFKEKIGQFVENKTSERN